MFHRLKSVLPSFVEPHVSEETLCRELPLRVEEVAFGHDYSAAITDQPGFGGDAALANCAQVIHFHLDSCETRIRFGRAGYRECHRGVDQRCDRAAVHDARELQVPLLDLEAQPGSSRLDRIELDAKRSREVIAFEFFTDQPKSFRGDIHSPIFLWFGSFSWSSRLFFRPLSPEPLSGLGSACFP
jgi:hypothetical protein